ncbi:MAG: hypothetical protein QM831_06800 [Kofleriaceae bacterium]
MPLAWTIPEGCPAESVFREAVAARVETEPSRGSIAIASRDGGFVAELAIADEHRELTAKTCDELVGAVAVIVAGLASEVVRTFVSVPRIVASPPRWNAAVGIEAIGGQSAAPDLDFGGELNLRGSYDAFDAAIGAARWLDKSQAGVAIQPSAITLRFGWHATHVRAWLSGELDHVTGDAAMAGSANAYLLGAGAGYAMLLARHISAVGTIEVEGTVHRVSFAAGDVILYETPRVTARAGLGVEFAWY